MKTVSLGVSTVVDIENTAVFNLSPETCGLLIKHLVGGLTETGVGMLVLRAYRIERYDGGGEWVSIGKAGRLKTEMREGV